MSDNAPDPEHLRALGQRLDEVQKRRAGPENKSPPAPLGIAFRFTAEMVSALVVGGGLGWGLDWLAGHFGFHTRPAFLILMFILGAAAGLRNVFRTAQEINAQAAEKKDKGK